MSWALRIVAVRVRDALERDVVLLLEGCGSFGIVLDVDAEERDVALVLRRSVDDAWHLLLAWRTPRRPVVDDDGLARRERSVDLRERWARRSSARWRGRRRKDTSRRRPRSGASAARYCWGPSSRSISRQLLEPPLERRMRREELLHLRRDDEERVHRLDLSLRVSAACSSCRRDLHERRREVARTSGEVRAATVGRELAVATERQDQDLRDE